MKNLILATTFLFTVTGFSADKDTVFPVVYSAAGTSSQSNSNKQVVSKYNRDVSNIQLGFDAGGESISAIQFDITSKLDVASFDISACSSNLPSTHIGGCKLKKDRIVFYAFSPTNAELPSGILGNLKLRSGAGVDSITLSNEVMSDTNGVELESDRLPKYTTK
mgnify:CR=1 FL=1